MILRMLFLFAYFVLPHQAVADGFHEELEFRVIDCETKCPLEFIQSDQLRTFLSTFSKSYPSITTIYYKLPSKPYLSHLGQCPFSKNDVDRQADLMLMEVDPKFSSVNPNPKLHSAFKSAIASSEILFFSFVRKNFEDLGGTPYEPSYLTSVDKVMVTYDEGTLEIAYSILKRFRVDPRSNDPIPAPWEYWCFQGS